MIKTKVFVSYSHIDEIWKDQIIEAFTGIFQEKDIIIWEDRQIAAGAHWEQEINQAIIKANIAVLLISENFLQSSFITQKEVPTILHRFKEEGLRIIPIILSDCQWQEIPWLKKVQVLPTDGVPLDQFTTARAEVLQKNISKIKILSQQHKVDFKKKLIRYLETVKEDAERIPSYFPHNAKLTNIRMQVRVSQKGIIDTAFSAEKREHIFHDPPSNASLYKYRMDNYGMKVIQRSTSGKFEDERIYEWDKEVRPRLKRGIVVGDPGFGKSWLLRWEAINRAEVAIKLLKEDGDMEKLQIPIRLRLFDIATGFLHLSSDLKQDLSEVILIRLKEMALKASEGTVQKMDAELLAFFCRIIGTSKAFLLLDALDEVPTVQNKYGINLKKTLINGLSRWIRHSEDPHLILTSRHANYSPPWDGIQQTPEELEMELLPFKEEQISAFIQAWFNLDLKLAIHLELLIKKSPQLKGMAELPLLLGFLCVIFESIEKGEDRWIIQEKSIDQTSRSSIYKAIIDKLLLKVWDQRDIIYSGDLLDKQEELLQLRFRSQLLQAIAFHFFVQGKIQFDQLELLALIEDFIQNEQYMLSPEKDDALTLIKELSQTRGILIEAGKAEDQFLEFLFLHLTFQEYLCAAYLGQFINEHGWYEQLLPGINLKPDTLIRTKAWDQRWEQVFLLLSSILNEPIELLNRLIEDDWLLHQRALAAHCLSEAWFNLQNDSQKKSNLLKVERDHLTQKLFNTWYGFIHKRSGILIPHLRSALPPLLRINGKINDVPAVTYLIQLVNTEKESRLQNALINLLGKAKNELIANSFHIELIFQTILQSENHEIRIKLVDLLLELGHLLYSSHYFPKIISDFLKACPEKKLAEMMEFFTSILDYAAHDFLEAKQILETFTSRPCAANRLAILDLLHKSHGIFVFIIPGVQFNKVHPKEAYEALDEIPELSRKLQLEETLKSDEIVDTDRLALDLIEWARELFNLFIELDWDKAMDFLHTIKIEDEKLVSLIFTNDEDLQSIMDDTKSQETFLIFLKRLLVKEGLLGTMNTIKGEDKKIDFVPLMIRSFLEMLMQDPHPTIKLKILEFLHDGKEELEGIHPQNTEDQQIIDDSIDDVIQNLLLMIEDFNEENEELYRALIEVIGVYSDSTSRVRASINQVQDLIEQDYQQAIEEIKQMFKNLGSPLWDHQEFLEAFLNGFKKINSQVVFTQKDLLKAISSQEALVDTFIDILKDDSNTIDKKAASIRSLGNQKDNEYRIDEICQLVAEGLYSKDHELVSVSLEAVGDLGKTVFRNSSVLDFLIEGLQKRNDKSMVADCAIALRSLTNSDFINDPSNEIRIQRIIKALLLAYQNSKNETVAYSIAFTLFAFSQSKYRFFKAAPSNWFQRIKENWFSLKTQIELKMVSELIVGSVD